MHSLTPGWVAGNGTSEETIGGMVPSFGVPTSPAPAGPGTAPDCIPVADLWCLLLRSFVISWTAGFAALPVIAAVSDSGLVPPNLTMFQSKT